MARWILWPWNEIYKSKINQLEQLEHLRSEDTPRCLMITHIIKSQVILLDPKSKEDKVKVTNLKNLLKLQIFVFWNKLYMPHTFWSCLIRYANMKWIRRVLLKIELTRFCPQTDRQTDGRTRWNQLRWSGGYNDLKSTHEYTGLIFYLYNCQMAQTTKS